MMPAVVVPLAILATCVPPAAQAPAPAQARGSAQAPAPAQAPASVQAPGSAQASASRLKTRWAADVDTAAPLPEYPRPQMTRPAWQSLNGRWDYALQDGAAPQPDTWDGHILVPFPVESQLSGVSRMVSEDQRLWYHRAFRASASAGGRLLLHFGAVDFDAVVWVNGQRIGEHRGGYDAFTFDITDALAPGGEQQLVVAVLDPTDAGEQPRGKQVRRPHSIWYTEVTGIWQTVWLEPVPDVHVTTLDIRPDVDSSRVVVRVDAAGTTVGSAVEVEAVANGRTVALGAGRTGVPLTLSIPEAHLWAPGDPFLYDLRVRLATGDSVSSYFGMRKIAVAPDSTGVLRLFLNNRPLFEYGLLDQGWWPDGLYTAPTDDALRSDIETTLRMGFNMARKHVKVEPARWYFWTDRLGLLVWQDMPSGENRTPAAREEFAKELQRMVEGLRNHPSIVMWVPFNEGWGQHDTERYATWLKAYDPTRLVNSATGWTDKGVGDVVDEHAYPGPAIPERDGRRARVLGEFGGLGLPLEGHTWLSSDNWGYRTFTDTVELGRAYLGLLTQLRYLESEGLAAAVYTQTTDVEVEVNGMMTYDRAVVKLPSAPKDPASDLYGPGPTVRAVVSTSRGEGQGWRSITTDPGADWTNPAFDDGGWLQGVGGFGRTRDSGTRVRTPWTTSDLWLRRSFVLGKGPLVDPHLVVRHDEDADIWIDGTRVATLSGYNQAYSLLPLDDDARSLLTPGSHTLAVHVKNSRGGQYIDVGIVEVLPPEAPSGDGAGHLTGGGVSVMIRRPPLQDRR
ncbi:MAG: hypothetical protein LJF04_07985 [Gemmatimonadetes bacterium]|nr:hypothetical protein [Gemmatimonadota bacterium]